MNSLLFFIIILFSVNTWAVSSSCKDQVKKAAASCDKEDFSSVFQAAFNKIPFDYESIKENLKLCTEAVALCYYNCENTTLGKSDSMGSVTSKLKESYGKKPHTTEIINCRGSLATYAKEVDGFCAGHYIEERSRMESKDKGLREISSLCKNFKGFVDSSELKIE